MEKKIVFMGTPEFASYILEQLCQTEYKPSLVVSQPDKKVGRKQILTPTPVKEVALKHEINVFQPENIKADYQTIVEFQPDLIITAAYGQIVPDEVLNAPKLECINVHGSLLPKYRGGAPIHYAVLNGDEKTGVTIMEMVAKMDAGAIIEQVEMPISETDTVGTVYDEMKKVGAKALIEVLPNIYSGNYTKTEQDETLVTYSPNITREQEKIDFNQSTSVVYNQIRGLNPWPVAYFIFNQKRYKVFASTKKIINHDYQIGEIIAISNLGVEIATNDGIINIIELQPAGKKKMQVKDYINGKVELIVGGICE